MKYKVGDKVRIKGRNIITEITEVKTVHCHMNGKHDYIYKVKDFPYGLTTTQMEEAKNEI